MSVGVILLAHTNLDRVAQLATHLASAGLHLAIHIDARTDKTDAARLNDQLQGNARILFVPRGASEWGRFSLVEASLRAADALLNAWPDTSHVIQVSGNCLPVRPLPELIAFLDTHTDMDFIESVPVAEGAWVRDGLSLERFTLHFPFSWQRQRRLFDLAVAVQRRLGIRRQWPDGLTPHIGSQWWCLTARTLRATLDDPERGLYDRYFARTWIPDESYFQTLARKHGRKIESRSLTFARFDHMGRPFTFYDDHADLLAGCGAFVARKIWPGAQGLYTRFLRGDGSGSEDGLDDRLHAAMTRRTVGRTGLLMAGRHPARGQERQFSTARPYVVLEGLADAIPDIQSFLTSETGVIAHGSLFGPHDAAFADESTYGPGNLAAHAATRDRNAVQYLINLIWTTRGQMQAFLFDPADNPRLATFIHQDPNAQVFRLGGDASPDDGAAVRHWPMGTSPDQIRADLLAALPPPQAEIALSTASRSDAAADI